jgi:hypothetical protein
VPVAAALCEGLRYFTQNIQLAGCYTNWTHSFVPFFQHLLMVMQCILVAEGSVNGIGHLYWGVAHEMNV